MREWCLIAPSGGVVNMAMVSEGKAPVLTTEQEEQGFIWIPVEFVSKERLEEYPYWKERP